MKIYTQSFSDDNTTKRLVFKIFKKDSYLNSNRSDTGIFMFQSDIPNQATVNRRIIEFKCTKYNSATVFSMQDIITNTSNINVYAVETETYVNIYVNAQRYSNVCVTLLSCDNPAIYETCPYSIDVMDETATYIEPTKLSTVKEVPFTYGSGFENAGKSQTINKLFLDLNSNMLFGQIYAKVTSAYASGSQTILKIPLINAQTTANRPGVFIADVYNTDKTWGKLNCYYDANSDSIIGYPTSITSKIYININAYIKDISSL